jgi:tetratricopeptide (TPR) repeat protein
MFKHSLLIIFLSSTCFNLQAQSDAVFTNREEQKIVESGKSLLDEKLYSLAYEHFSKLLATHPKDLYLKYLCGICGIFINTKHDEAMTYFNEVKDKNPKAANLDYYFALLYHKIYDFEQSIELAQQLLNNPKLDTALKTKLKLVIEHCENGKNMVAHKTETKIENIGLPINTEADEYSPVITSDESTLLFTYRGKLSKGGLRDIYDRPNKYGFYYEDVYISRKENGKWQEPVGLDNINTESNEAVLAISNDGQQLFIYRATEKDGGDIYMSCLQGKEFGKPEKLKGDVNTPNWEGSITITGDEKKIIFASDRAGGYGGKDLYQAIKTGENTWGNVTNLGNTINTNYDEDAPFIHPDGRSLVFSSEGHNSIGDYDIFLTELDERDSSWKKPVNVGYPINTTDDDIFYTLSADGKRGYFSSAKNGGFGNKDIYVEQPVVFSKNSNLTIVKGQITENNQPYGGDVIVLAGNDNHNYGTFKSNNLSGNFLISLPAGKNYKILYNHPAYEQKVVELTMDKDIGYSELIVNVNFGEKNASPNHQLLVLSPKDTNKQLTALNTLSANTNPNQTNTSENTNLKKMTRAQLLSKYGDVKVGGLNYMVQVGAYRKTSRTN